MWQKSRGARFPWHFVTYEVCTTHPEVDLKLIFFTQLNNCGILVNCQKVLLQYFLTDHIDRLYRQGIAFKVGVFQSNAKDICQIHFIFKYWISVLKSIWILSVGERVRVWEKWLPDHQVASVAGPKIFAAEFNDPRYRIQAILPLFQGLEVFQSCSCQFQELFLSYPSSSWIWVQNFPISFPNVWSGFARYFFCSQTPKNVFRAQQPKLE